MKKKQILFIQGGGDGGYEADKALVKSLQNALGEEYDVHYPELQSDESASDFGWIGQIEKEIAKTKGSVVLVGHSLGASMLLKYLSENPVNKNIDGIFLVATPFWSGSEEWKQGLKLKENFADTLPDEVPFFLYHAEDDEEVPFSHFEHYRKTITQATFRKTEIGGHQLGNDLSWLAKDIKSLTP